MLNSKYSFSKGVFLLAMGMALFMGSDLGAFNITRLDERSLDKRKKRNDDLIGSIYQHMLNSDRVAAFNTAMLKTMMSDNEVKKFLKDFGKEIGEGVAKGQSDPKVIGGFIKEGIIGIASVRNLSILGGIAIAVPAAVFGFKFAFERWRKSLDEPNIVAETNFKGGPVKKRDMAGLDKFIAPKEFRADLMQLAEVLASNAKGRHRGVMALFYGSPGTGKTYAVRGLAAVAGRFYAMINGHIIAEHPEPVVELTKTFSWAKQNNIVLVIDEAEAVISKKIKDEKRKGISNYIISQTGDPADRPDIILMTNIPGEIDSRFISPSGGRVDYPYEFPIPDKGSIALMLKTKLKDATDKAGLRVGIPDTDYIKLAEMFQSANLCGRDVEALTGRVVALSATLDKDEQGKPFLNTSKFEAIFARFLTDRQKVVSFQFSKDAATGAIMIANAKEANATQAVRAAGA